MSFPTFPFDYNPQNPVQQNDLPVVSTLFEDAFSDNGFGLQQVLLPQYTQIESQDFINEPELGIMQNMSNNYVPALEQAQVQQPMEPGMLPDLADGQAVPFFMQEQEIPTELSFTDMFQFEDTAAEVPPQQVPQPEPQVQQQQIWESEHLANEFGLLYGTEQPQIPVHDLGSQLGEAKEHLQKKAKSLPSLRLRIRLQPNAGPQKKMDTNPEADFQLEDLLPQPCSLHPIQVRFPSDPVTDLFGHSEIPIVNHMPRRPEPYATQIQPEHAPNEEISPASLPFWKVENPSNIPAYNFLLREEDNSTDPLAVINTNLLANEIIDGAAEVATGTQKGVRNADRKGNTNGNIYSIDRPSEFTRTKLFENVGTEDTLVHEIPAIFTSNFVEEQKTPGRRKMQTNEQEPRGQRRVGLFPRSTNSDSEEDEDDGSDPSYIPGEASEHPGELTDHFYDSDRPETVKRQHPKTAAIALTYCDPSNNGDREEMNASKSHFDHVTCPKCNDVFANSDSLDRHSRLVHSNAKEKVHVCKECQQTCRNEQNLRRHWSNVHTGDLKFICDVCRARFSTKRSLSLHRTKQHPDVYKPRPKRKKNKFHECQMCDYTSDQSYNVIRHFFTKHTDKVAMECLYGCGKTFKSVSNAKVHFSKCKRRPVKDE